MSSPDRQPVPETPLTAAPSHAAPLPAAPLPAAPLTAALRPDGRAPRSRAERLLMLGTLTAISLAVAIPTLVVTEIFGQRPRPQPKVAVTQATPTPDSGLNFCRSSENARTLFCPPPLALDTRPDHRARYGPSISPPARKRWPAKPRSSAARRRNGLCRMEMERHLFVDLPAAQTAAFRLCRDIEDTGGSPSASRV